jgi:MFS family permease
MDRGTLARAVAPLRHPLYRAMWISSLASNVGTLMHAVGAAWLMTTLATTPLVIALVQTATYLPTFLFGLFGGVLADTVDRRKILLFTQSWMLAAACLMGVLTIAGRVNPVWLLALTFALNFGSALNGPAWQTTTPELASRDELPAVIALNGVQFNIARAIGPAIGGIVMAMFGAGVTFLANALSFLGVILVLWRWMPALPPSRPHTASVAQALRAGLRFVRGSTEYHALLGRSAWFAFSFTALWALLPVAARERLHLSAFGYGMLLGALGLGAVVGAGIQAGLRGTTNPDGQAMFGVLLGTASLTGVGLAPSFLPAALSTFGCGAAWMISMSVFNVRSQTAAPAEVRARSIAVFMLVFQGAMALGSSFWGAVAGHVGVRAAFVSAAALTLSGLALASRLKLSSEVEEATLSHVY